MDPGWEVPRAVFHFLDHPIARLLYVYCIPCGVDVYGDFFSYSILLRMEI